MLKGWVRAPGTEQHIAPAGVSPLLWELGKRPETRAQAGHRARIASPMFRGGRGPRAPASPKTTAETLRRHRKSHGLEPGWHHRLAIAVGYLPDVPANGGGLPALRGAWAQCAAVEL